MLSDFKDQQLLAYNLFVKDIDNKCVTHAYLIDENNYVDAYNMVLSFVKAILCENKYLDNINCSDCTLCKRIDDGNYPELKIIEPDGMYIKKQQIIDLQQVFSRSSVEGSKRIYIIKDCEKMRPEAANSMLKFLEEPESGIIAILMTNNINASVPYVIVKYANGGTLGYNYMSGEVLFDNRVKDQVSISDYAGEYYSNDDTSMYANISSTYKENLNLLSGISSIDELDNLLGSGYNDSQESNSENETEKDTEEMTDSTKPVGKPEIETEPETDTEEDVNQAVNNRKFMAVYDVEKGAYTIVFVENYLVDSEYKSENDRVGVDNLASVIKGKVDNATSKKDENTERGIWMYLIVATLLATGMVSFVPVLRKNLKYKKR